MMKQSKTISIYFYGRQHMKSCLIVCLNEFIINQIQMNRRLIKLLSDKFRYIQLKMLSLDHLNPDWEFASKHGKASLTGKPFEGKSKLSKSEICPCCFQFIYKDPVPLCTNPKQLQFLGFGFPLFYIFLKNCMILLLISICSYNAISLKKAFDHNYTLCHSQSSNTQTHRRLLGGQQIACFTFMIEMARVESEVTSQQQILRISSFIIQLLFLIYMRDHITKLESYYNQRQINLSDFSIMLKNIPKQTNIQSKLKEFFLNEFQERHEVKKITLLPQYPEIDQLSDDRQKAINRLKKAYKKDVFSEQDYKDEQFIKKIDIAIYDEIMASNELVKRDLLQCQKAILVFNTQQERTTIIQQFQKMDFSTKGPYFGVGSEKISIKVAPEPKEICWENVNVPHKTKVLLYIVAWGLSILVLGVVTLAVYFIYEYKAQNLLQVVNLYSLHPDDEKYKTRYMRAISTVYLALLLIILFNKFVMAILFHKITEIQRHETLSKFQFSFALRYALGLFFTTALMTLIVEALVFQNYYSHPYGVIQQQTLMFFLNAFFVPIYWLINPFEIMKKIQRKLKYGKKYLTQLQANILMQKSHYNMGKRYAEIIESMWFTFLYATIVPIGAFISLAGIAIYYWVDKYNLLRRSSLGGQISGHVVLASMKLLDFTLILRPIGELIFDYQIRNKTGIISTSIMIGIGFLYLILPIDKIIEKANPENFKMAQKTYEQIKRDFKDTYHSEHPICKVIYASKHYTNIMTKGMTIDKKSSLKIGFLESEQGKNMESFEGKFSLNLETQTQRYQTKSQSI